MTDPIALTYRAFISYSHADTGWARWLHRGLEGFRIDKDLVGRETDTGKIPKSLRPIFRDRDDFTAGHSLTDQTLAALNASAALIVICSPSAGKSRYVNEEIRLFKSRNPGRPVIPLIVDGKPGGSELECFPTSLRLKVDTDGRITDEPVEILAADAREEGDGKNLALAKIVAGLFGVSSDNIYCRAERERRRRGRMRSAIIAVLAVLALAASGSAVYAWQQLKTNEAFLTATLKTATKIVDEAVAQAEKYGVPRSATLALLTKAEGLFDNMALLGRPTPELRYQKAWMLIEFARNYAILGDTRKQKSRAEEAQRLMAKLVGEISDDAEKLYGLSAALIEKGNALKSQGNLLEAHRVYMDSLAIALQVYQDSLDRVEEPSPHNAVVLASAYNGIGDVLETAGDRAEALRAYTQAMAIVERLTEGNPGNAVWQQNLFVTQAKVGSILEAQGHLAEALTYYKDSLAVADRLAKADASNTVWQRDLSVAHSKVGGVLEAQGHLAEALKAYRQSLAVLARLATVDPSNAVWQRDLSVTHGKFGGVLEAQGHLHEALKAYRQSLALLARLATVDPSNAVWQRDLSVTHSKVGSVLEAQGNLSEALQSYRDALAIFDRLTNADPRRGWVLQHNLLLELKGQGQLPETLKFYQDSLAIADRLAKADPDNADWQRSLSVANEKVGDVLQAQGNLGEALAAYQDSLAISERLAATDPSDAGWQRDIAVSHCKIAFVLEQQGEMARALSEYRAGREIVARLKEQSPDHATLSSDLTQYDAEIARLEQAGTSGGPVTAQPEQGAQW